MDSFILFKERKKKAIILQANIIKKYKINTKF